MRADGKTWGVVLAAGDGQRMRALARDDDGNAVPKQFWRFDGRRSLLEVALERAARIADPRRIVPIVAAPHRHLWTEHLRGVPRSNVVVQPSNRGTAAGILLPLLHIARRDPDARVFVLPADHTFVDEALLRTTMERTLCEVERWQNQVILLGVEPGGPDPDLGYIVPAQTAAKVGDSSRSRPVLRFVEKPDSASAAALIRQGALWNAFIMGARLETWLDVFRAQNPDLVLALDRGLARRRSRTAHLRALYAALPSSDFSRDVLWRSVDRLRVLAAPDCGWTDLGTPDRYTRWLEEALPNALSA